MLPAWIVQRVKKREVVLTVANKDGGAHVDSQLPENYMRAKENPPVAVQSIDGGQPVSIDFMRCVVADAGFELLEYLNSHFS